MNKSDFIKNIDILRKSHAYQIYQEVRDRVFLMLQNAQTHDKSAASAYWRQELAGFEYMFDASPLIIDKLRHHCYHLTGLKEYDYRNHHSRGAPKLAKLLTALRQQDRNNVLVPESPLLGGFGFMIDGALYNVDTLKFYESLLVLDDGHALDQFRTSERRRMVLEIGAGWGGFSYAFKTLFPHTTYVIIDLPGSILFGATYLRTVFPSARVFVSDGNKAPSSMKEALEYDFLFFPNFMWPDLKFLKADLVVNIASFQEMTEQQVEQYIAQCVEHGYPYLYSNNRDTNPNNPELSCVSRIIEKYYTIASNRPGGQYLFYRRPFLSRMRAVMSGQKKNNNHGYRHIMAEINRI